jgi:hypothetical protein
MKNVWHVAGLVMLVPLQEEFGALWTLLQML